MQGGGQNPLEAARLGSVVMAGPQVSTFRDIYDQMNDCRAIAIVQTADELATAVHHFDNL